MYVERYLLILEYPTDLLFLKKPHVRLLGLDLGTKTLGLALSDTHWIIASPFKTLERQKLSLDIKKFQTIFEEFNIGALIIGLPINMNGTEGPKCQSARQFAQNFLTYHEIPICFWDERLSTVAVSRIMIEADISRKRQGEVVDKMAASYILQGLLDRIKLKNQR